MRTYRRHPLLLCERKRNEWFCWDFLSWMSGMNLFCFSFFFYRALTNYFLWWGRGGAKLHPLTGFLPWPSEFLQRGKYLVSLCISELIPLFTISITTEPTNAAAQERGGIHLKPLTFNRNIQAQLFEKNAKRKIRKLDFKWIIIIMINDINNHHHHHHYYYYC